MADDDYDTPAARAVLAGMTPRKRPDGHVVSDDEPVFIRQTSGLHTADERHAWMQAQVGDAFQAGCTFARASFDEATGTVLYEGWIERPAEQGEPRWKGDGNDD